MVIFDWYKESTEHLVTTGSLRLLAYGVTFCCSLVLALVVTPPVRSLARRFGIVDQPGGRRIHTHPTPRAGGVAVFLAFHGSLLLCFLLFPDVFRPSYGFEKMGAFFWASLVLLAVGLVDDALSLKPYVKLAGQVVAATMLYRAGFRVGGGFSVALPDTLNVVITFFWIVGAINAFNLIDGMDGLAAGLATIAAFGLAGALFMRNLSVDALPFIALAGAAMGFLRYNFNPASVFLGDSGSMFLGLAVGALPLISGQKSELLASLGVPLIAMGIPIFDTALAIWRRSLRSAFPEIAAVGSKRIRGFMQGDKDHIHHRVLAQTMSQRRAAIVLYGLNVLLVGVGLASILAAKRQLGVFLLAFIVGVFLVVKHLIRVELWDTGRVLLAHAPRSVSARISVPCYMMVDVVVVSGALVLSHFLMGIPFGVRQLVVELPTLVGIIFVLLALTGTYQIIWSRALFRDFARFAVVFCAGLGAVFAVSVFFETYDMIRFPLVVVFIGLALPVMLLSRLSREVLRESVYDIERTVLANSDDAVRVLVCGGGERLRAYLREKQLRIGCDMTTVVGVLDDDLKLHKRRVYGIKVVGTVDALGEQVQQQRATQIVIAARLSPSRRERILQLATAAGVPVYEWTIEIKRIEHE